MFFLLLGPPVGGAAVGGDLVVPAAGAVHVVSVGGGRVGRLHET